jgi:hypothetical protein
LLGEHDSNYEYLGKFCGTQHFLDSFNYIQFNSIF